jgi:hypothetical protein
MIFKGKGKVFRRILIHDSDFQVIRQVMSKNFKTIVSFALLPRSPRVFQIGIDDLRWSIWKSLKKFGFKLAVKSEGCFQVPNWKDILAQDSKGSTEFFDTHLSGHFFCTSLQI